MRLYTPDECTGRDGYPPAWHDSIKHAVREAAGHCCVRCMHPYLKGMGEWSACTAECRHSGPIRYTNNLDRDGWYETTLPDAIQAGAVAAVWHRVEARYRILTVHHLDGNKGNCRWWNLAALCQRCHLQIQGKVDMRRVYPWPHSEWFRPYVAGYYAWTYLGEEVSRVEALGRLDELLALELAGVAPARLEERTGEVDDYE